MWAALMNSTVRVVPGSNGWADSRPAPAHREVVDPAGDFVRPGHLDQARRQPAGGEAPGLAALDLLALGGGYGDFPDDACLS